MPLVSTVHAYSPEPQSGERDLALLNAIEQVPPNPEGSSEKRILGNRVRPKDRAN